MPKLLIIQREELIFHYWAIIFISRPPQLLHLHWDGLNYTHKLFSSDDSWVHQEQLLHLAQSIDRDLKEFIAKYHTFVFSLKNYANQHF